MVVFSVSSVSLWFIRWRSRLVFRPTFRSLAAPLLRATASGENGAPRQASPPVPIPPRATAPTRRGRGARQAVLWRGRKETERAVEVQGVAFGPAFLGLANQTPKLHESHELTKPLWRLVADRDMDARRAQQHRLGQSDIVALQQP